MIAQKLILSYGSKLVIEFIQVVASIVVARIAGPTVLGTVAFSLAFVSMFEFIADLGIGVAHMKLISEGQDIGKCISTYAVLKIINIFLFVIVVLGLFLVQKHILHIKFESVAHEYVIIIFLIAGVLNQLLYIPSITFAAKTEQAKQSILEFIKTFIYQILRVIIVFLGYRAVALAFGNLISTIIVIPLVIYLFKDYPRSKFDKQLATRYIKISLPILIIAMSTNVIFYLDRVALQYFTNSEQVGYYTAGYRIGAFVVMIASSVGMLFFPLFSKAASAHNFEYIKRTISKFERFIFLFIMPGVIFLSLYSDVIVKVLLGDQYSSSIPILTIINVAMFMMVLNTPYGNVITGMGFFRLTALLNIANLFLFILLIYVLPNPKVLNLGAVGVAITVLISNLFLGCVNRVFAKQKCPIINLSQSIKFILFGVINYLMFFLLYTNLSNWYGISGKIAFVLVYFIVTYLALYLLGWIHKDDLQTIKEVINFRKMGSYIDKEMRGR